MLAQKIVDEVLSDLHGRKGVGDELDQVRHDDEETYEELRSTLKSKVEALIKPLHDEIDELETAGPHDED